jgi:hypothetical protein
MVGPRDEREGGAGDGMAHFSAEIGKRHDFLSEYLSYCVPYAVLCDKYDTIKATDKQLKFL